MTDTPTYDALIRPLIFAPLALLWIVLLVRVAGTRTLSKMTAFDFVVTLAAASLLATAASASNWTSFVQAMASMAVLIAAQAVLAGVRRFRSARLFLENEPLLLMRDGSYIDSAMKTARITRADLHGKLRQAGLTSPDAVAYMVLETTGDISILAKGEIDERMMAGVRGIDSMTA